MIRSPFVCTLTWVLALFVANIYAIPYEDKDDLTLKEELETIKNLISSLEKRKLSIESALDIPSNSIVQSFHSGFIPIGKVSTKVDQVVSLDVFRIFKRDKIGIDYYFLSGYEDGTLLLSNSQDQPITKTSALDDSCLADGEKLKTVQTSSSGTRPFAVTLSNKGILKVHGFSFQKGLEYEKCSFWKVEQSINMTRDLKVEVRPSLYTHLNLSVSIFEIHSTVTRAWILMGGDSAPGQVHFLDPFTNHLSIVDTLTSSFVTHFTINQNVVAVAFLDGTIRLITLGTNRLIPNSVCIIPSELGIISSLIFLDTQTPRDRQRHLVVQTSKNDILILDRRGIDQVTGRDSLKTRRGLLATLFASKNQGPVGKQMCSLLRRFPRKQFQSIFSLPENLILAHHPIRGPEVYESSRFGLVLSQYFEEGKNQLKFVKRSDFVDGGSNMDFAIIVHEKECIMIYSYLQLSQIEQQQHYIKPDGGEGIITTVLSFVTSRGPVVVILAIAAVFMQYNKRSNRANRQMNIPDDLQNLEYIDLPRGSSLLREPRMMGQRPRRTAQRQVIRTEEIGPSSNEPNSKVPGEVTTDVQGQQILKDENSEAWAMPSNAEGPPSDTSSPMWSRELN